VSLRKRNERTKNKQNEQKNKRTKEQKQTKGKERRATEINKSQTRLMSVRTLLGESF
jgi:hypothetical protein